jgi:hypothetical protein
VRPQNARKRRAAQGGGGTSKIPFTSSPRLSQRPFTSRRHTRNVSAKNGGRAATAWVDRQNDNRESSSPIDGGEPDSVQILHFTVAVCNSVCEIECHVTPRSTGHDRIRFQNVNFLWLDAKIRRTMYYVKIGFCTYVQKPSTASGRWGNSTASNCKTLRPPVFQIVYKQ